MKIIDENISLEEIIDILKEIDCKLIDRGFGGTIIPNKEDKVLERGNYKGDIVIKGDCNLVPENIVEGKIIFGVEGTFEGGIKTSRELHSKKGLRLFASMDGKINKIYELDKENLQAINESAWSSISNSGIGGGFDGKKLRIFFAENVTGKIYELDSNSLGIVKKADSPVRYYGRGIGGGFDGKKLRLFYCNDGYGSQQAYIYEINPETLQVINTVSPNSKINSIYGIGGGFDGKKLRLFCTDYGSNVIYELNPDTFDIINEKRVSIGEYMGSTGIGGGFDGTKLRLFYNNYKTNRIYEVDPDTLEIIKCENNRYGGQSLSGIGGGHQTQDLYIDVLHYKNKKYDLSKLSTIELDI